MVREKYTKITKYESVWLSPLPVKPIRLICIIKLIKLIIKKIINGKLIIVATLYSSILFLYALNKARKNALIINKNGSGNTAVTANASVKPKKNRNKLKNTTLPPLKTKLINM